MADNIVAVPYANSRQGSTALADSYLIEIQQGSLIGNDGLAQMGRYTLGDIRRFLAASSGNVFNFVGAVNSLPTNPMVNDYFLASETFSTYIQNHLYAYNGTTWNDISGLLADYIKKSDYSQAGTVNHLAVFSGNGDFLNPTSTPTLADLEPVDNVTTQSATKSLSANMGYELQLEIDALKARGRFLSTWNCTTGLPGTNPLEMPYAYKAGDYYIVSVVGATNYKPSGSSYTGTASTTVETDEVAENDFYAYDGTTWILVINTQKTVTFSQIAGNATDNTSLATALGTKQDTLTFDSTPTQNSTNPVYSGGVYTYGEGIKNHIKERIGEVWWFAGKANKIPAGNLICNGSSVLITDYPDLFEVLGDTYGQVDNTHFNLPDLITDSRFIRATDGTDLGQTQIDEIRPLKGVAAMRSGDSGYAAGFANEFTGAMSLNSQGGTIANHDAWDYFTVDRKADLVEFDANTNSNGSNTNEMAGHANGSDIHPANIALIPLIKAVY